MEMFTFCIGMIFFSVFLAGLISPSICEYSGNCTSNINFYLIGGIGLLGIIIGSIIGE